MKLKTVLMLLVFCLCGASQAQAQGKGSDRQKETVRDAGSNRTPGNNGGNTGVGAGRGFDFGAGRTPAVKLLDNPLRLSARREAVFSAVQELIVERKMILDEAGDAAGKRAQGLFVCQPYTFAKGSTVTESDLNRYAVGYERTASGGWTRGRYTMIIEVLPIDATNSQVSVTARVEGKLDGITGSQWITLESSGNAEQEFLAALAEKLGIATPEN